MEYKSYQHIEKLGRDEIDGLLKGTCSIQTKIDGTNAVLWLGDDGNVHAGSRKRELSLKDDNAGFMNAIEKMDCYRRYLEDHPNHYLYGEWLVKHTIKSYNDDAWRKFYVFDVYELNELHDDGSPEISEGHYVPYKEYSAELDKYGIDYIPEIAELTNPTLDDIAECINRTHFLMPEGGVPEGVVVKNYDYVNRFGRTVWGKLITEEFLSNKKDLRMRNHENKNNFEQKIADEYITDAVIKKEYAKLLNERPDAGRPEMIGRILNAVYNTFIEEDIVHVIKKNKNCTINFQLMKKSSDARVKEVLTELF